MNVVVAGGSVGRVTQVNECDEKEVDMRWKMGRSLC